MAAAHGLAQIKKGKRKFIGFIGGYLIEDGVLTLEQLDRGLLRQLNLAEAGRSVHLEQVLIDLGYVTKQDIARATERRRRDQMRLRRPKKH